MTTDPNTRHSRASIALARAVRAANRHGSEEARQARADAEAELTAARLHKQIAAALAAEGTYALKPADREQLAAYLLAGGEAR